MIQMFSGLGAGGVGDTAQLAGGIGKALVCTATGMLVAIPALVAHRFFRARVSGYVLEMEREASALIDALDSGAAPVAPATARKATPATGQG